MLACTTIGTSLSTAKFKTFNDFPVELVFEVAAAWDHLSRHWKYGESEKACVDKAARHIKRAVFDAYKLLLKNAVDEYDQLLEIDTSLIDNGHYDQQLRLLMSEIRNDSIAARTAEGDTCGTDGWNRAFSVWNDAHQKIQRFVTEFYLNPNVDWARRKTTEFSKKRRWEGFWLGLASAVAGAVVYEFIVWLVARWKP